MYLYFIQGEFTGLIKIGKTETAPADRMRSFQTGSPDRLLLLKSVRYPKNQNYEKEVHDRFAHLRTHGEWFRPDTNLLLFIENAIDLGYDPPVKPKVSERDFRVRSLFPKLQKYSNAVIAWETGTIELHVELTRLEYNAICKQYPDGYERSKKLREWRGDPNFERGMPLTTSEQHKALAQLVQLKEDGYTPEDPIKREEFENLINDFLYSEN
jgi:hypothetical protein